jgi:2'-5' RNA ligase
VRLPERNGDQVRLGIALAVPEPFARELRAARASFGDPLADAIPPHVTLVGPTVLERAQLAELDAHLAAVAAAHSPFTVHLRGTGSFRPVSDVVFVQVVEGIAECEQLELALRDGPLAQPLRFHYHPHVTVAHDLGPEVLDRAFDALANFEAQFLAPDIAVFEGGDDGVWHPVRSVPLAG